MTAVPVALAHRRPRRRAWMPAYRFELVKLLAQWRIRALLATCWVAPAVLVAVMSHQGNLPTDTVFGRWLNQSGWAGPLVLLAFCGSWVLPVLTSVVAGDVFAVEDRLGTWRHLVVITRSLRRIFWAKASASGTVLLLLAVGLAVSATLGGLAAAGNRPLVGLDGHTLAVPDASVAVLLAWATALAPTLAFAAVGLLGSVALGRSPVGLLAPALLALLLQVVQLLPVPVAVRVALPSYAFGAWRGLFIRPAPIPALLTGVAVSLLWAVVATALAYRIFIRRDFSTVMYDGAGWRTLAVGVLPLAAILAVTTVTVAAASPASGSGIGRAALERSVATAYGHLYRLQLHELHRPDVAEGQLQTTASCDKGGASVADNGPGNDWRCVVAWHIPGAAATGAALYQLDVAPDGRYVADGDGPQDVNGFFRVRAASGDAPNPLWQFDGFVDLLTTSSKG